MRYHSRLKVVIQQRQHREDRTLNEFAETLRLLSEAEDRFTGLQSVLEETYHHLADKQAKGINPDEIGLYHQFIRRRCGELEKEREEMRLLLDACEVKRQQLKQATLETKLAEKIEAIRKKTFLKEVEKKEQHLFDEIAGRQKREPT